MIPESSEKLLGQPYPLLQEDKEAMTINAAAKKTIFFKDFFILIKSLCYGIKMSLIKANEQNSQKIMFIFINDVDFWNKLYIPSN